MNERPQDWSNCPPGLIAHMVHAQRVVRIRHSAIRISVVIGTVVLVSTLTARWAMVYTPASRLGGLTCVETMDLIEGYHHGRLDNQRARRVEAHLVTCTGCLRHFQRWRQTQSSETVRQLKRSGAHLLADPDRHLNPPGHRSFTDNAVWQIAGGM